MDVLERVAGVWVAGASRDQRGTVDAYRAGNLICTDGSFGEPGEFRLDDGRDGHAFLLEAAPFPSTHQFRYGCFRDAVAAACYQAISGGWYGNVNFSGGDLYVDNQQGETGIAVLRVHCCYGVFGSGDPFRPYETEVALAKAPTSVRDQLQDVCKRYAEHYSQKPTAIFWSETDRLCGAEPFHVLYAYGLETLGSVLLNDSAWHGHVDDNYGGEISREAAEDIIAVAREHVRTGRPVSTSREVLDRLFPPNSPGRESALEGVTDPNKFIRLIDLVESS